MQSFSIHDTLYFILNDLVYYFGLAKTTTNINLLPLIIIFFFILLHTRQILLHRIDQDQSHCVNHV